MTTSNQLERIVAFKSLHDSGCFLLPNPWDAGTALFLERAGFKALATTSSGFAWTQGLPDDPAAIPLELMLDHVSAIVNATSLPVNADFQNGFAHDPEAVAANVIRCVDTGVAGLSIEDNPANGVDLIYEKELAVERIRAARKAIDQADKPVILTARCEAWLTGVENPFETAIERLSLYAEAGADCLYAPGVSNTEQIAAIVRAVAPKPVNVLVSRPMPGVSLASLTELGVRRISLGSALTRVAWGAFIRSANDLINTGQFDSLTDAAPFADVNNLFLTDVQ